MVQRGWGGSWGVEAASIVIKSKQYLLRIRCPGWPSLKKRLLYQVSCNSKSWGLRTGSAGVGLIALLLVEQLACGWVLVLMDPDPSVQPVTVNSFCAMHSKPHRRVPSPEAEDQRH